MLGVAGRKGFTLIELLVGDRDYRDPGSHSVPRVQPGSREGKADDLFVQR